VPYIHSFWPIGGVLNCIFSLTRIGLADRIQRELTHVKLKQQQIVARHLIWFGRRIACLDQGDQIDDFLIYFRRKIQIKNWRFLLKTKLNFEKNMIITLVFKKNANFFAENWEKSQKIVIITSTPDEFVKNDQMKPSPFYRNWYITFTAVKSMYTKIWATSVIFKICA
jgi:hypothetical protein